MPVGDVIICAFTTLLYNYLYDNGILWQYFFDPVNCIKFHNNIRVNASIYRQGLKKLSHLHLFVKFWTLGCLNILYSIVLTAYVFFHSFLLCLEKFLVRKPFLSHKKALVWMMVMFLQPATIHTKTIEFFVCMIIKCFVFYDFILLFDNRTALIQQLATHYVETTWNADAFFIALK